MNHQYVFFILNDSYTTFTVFLQYFFFFVPYGMRDLNIRRPCLHPVRHPVRHAVNNLRHHHRNNLRHNIRHHLRQEKLLRGEVYQQRLFPSVPHIL